MGVSKKTLVVDGNNLLVRSIRAMERVELSANGVPTAAINTFIRTLTFFVRHEAPDRMLVCWDGGRSIYRTEIWPQYKANRVHIDHDVPEGPFALAKEFLSVSNIRHIEHHGVEADDLIATYWSQRLNDERLVILSADKDFLQLLDGWTEQIRPGTGVDERWTANRVRTEMKCKPENLPYVMALAGDNGDGIPGLAGIGHKTGCKLLAQQGWSLDRLMEKTTNTKLVGRRDEVMRNLKLVNLRQPIPGVQVSLAPRFEPTDIGGILSPEFLSFVDHYQLRWVRERFLENSLWKES